MRNVALALASLVVALLLAEVAVRAFDVLPRPLEPLDLPTYQLSSNPILGYEYRRDYRQSDAAYNRGHRGFETNSQGFRDREYDLDKPQGTVRIALLGDSVTAGNNVRRVEDVYAKVLERRLNEATSDRTFEVINMGVGGYETHQEVELLRVRGLEFQPDYVIVGVCINDFDRHTDGGVRETLARMNRERDTGGARLRYADDLLGRSRLAFVLHHRLRSQRETADPAEDSSPVVAGLRLLARLQQDNGFEVLLFVIPSFEAAFSDYRHEEIHRRIAEVAGRFPNLRLVDLRPRMAEVNDRAWVFSFDGVHLNPYGHEVLGAILHEELDRRWFRDGET